jgi:hypothetical protein
MLNQPISRRRFLSVGGFAMSSVSCIQENANERRQRVARQAG